MIKFAQKRYNASREDGANFAVEATSKGEYAACWGSERELLKDQSRRAVYMVPEMMGSLFKVFIVLEVAVMGRCGTEVYNSSVVYIRYTILSERCMAKFFCVLSLFDRTMKSVCLFHR